MVNKVPTREEAIESLERLLDFAKNSDDSKVNSDLVAADYAVAATFVKNKMEGTHGAPHGMFTQLMQIEKQLKNEGVLTKEIN